MTPAADTSTWTSRAGILALGILVGIIYGSVATIGHRNELSIGAVVVPWGLVAAIVGVLALLVGVRLVAGGRLAAVGAAVGIVGTVALLTLPGPGGSVLVTGDVRGTVWAVAPALVAVLVVAWPELPARRRAATGAA
ncbi:histidinol dehydrogenase [Agromyces sp. NPDC049794]|uniref:histidinol dehydrogenase n=1 Tax=unclassified Agromyces TaxID=2639701 RepID=UPI0033DC3C88